MFCLSSLDIDYIDNLKFFNLSTQISRIRFKLNFNFLNQRQKVKEAEYLYYYKYLNKIIRLYITCKNWRSTENYLFDVRIRILSAKPISIKGYDNQKINIKSAMPSYKRKFIKFINDNYGYLNEYIPDYIKSKRNNNL